LATLSSCASSAASAGETSFARQMIGVTRCDWARGRAWRRTAASGSVSSTDSGISAMPVPEPTQATMAWYEPRSSTRVVAALVSPSQRCSRRR